jgi:squalene synthase HpnC
MSVVDLFSREPQASVFFKFLTRIFYLTPNSPDQQGRVWFVQLKTTPLNGYMLSHDLKIYGPDATPCLPIELGEAQRYCRALAKRHYENFTVASWLLPLRLRQHFFNLYAYCRWADDLADEIANPAESLRLLDWWETKLRDCFLGHAVHPVFVALTETIKSFTIPIDPFVELLTAFRQDQCVTRYDSFDDVLKYCRCSANPVGHLVLYLGGCYSDERTKLSNSICTGLQLANFCQDVAIDWDRGRIYLPQNDCRDCGYTEEMFKLRDCNESFIKLMKLQVDRAEKHLLAGLPLVEIMPKELRLDIALFINGGLAILNAVRRLRFNVWAKRPTVSKIGKLWLFIKEIL